MRVISVKPLREFWRRYADAEQPLRAWIDEMKRAEFLTPNDVLGQFPSADTVGNNRIVFNIRHNQYRLIALFRYRIQRVYIRFIGTHEEYDRIRNIKEI
jgi:mRNA interferase HigB